MKKFLLIFLCLCMVICFVSCGSKYKAEDFIGKTSSEIIEEYGEFDCVCNTADDDGIYRSTRCGYTVGRENVFFGDTWEVLFFIYFDENGVAYKCSDKPEPRPGG